MLIALNAPKLGSAIGIVKGPATIERAYKMADSLPCYKERKDQSGHWYWIYYARNGEAIARSSESYVKRSDCEHSISLVQNSTNDPIYYYE